MAGLESEHPPSAAAQPFRFFSSSGTASEKLAARAEGKRMAISVVISCLRWNNRTQVACKTSAYFQVIYIIYVYILYIIYHILWIIYYILWIIYILDIILNYNYFIFYSIIFYYIILYYIIFYYIIYYILSTIYYILYIVYYICTYHYSNIIVIKLIMITLDHLTGIYSHPKGPPADAIR